MFGVRLIAHGQGAVADTVVYFHFQRHGLAGLGQGGDVRLKGQESINRKRPPSPACGESSLAVLGYKVSPLVAMTCLYQLKDFFL